MLEDGVPHDEYAVYGADANVVLTVFHRGRSLILADRFPNQRRLTPEIGLHNLRYRSVSSTNNRSAIGRKGFPQIYTCLNDANMLHDVSNVDSLRTDRRSNREHHTHRVPRDLPVLRRRFLHACTDGAHAIPSTDSRTVVG